MMDLVAYKPLKNNRSLVLPNLHVQKRNERPVFFS